MIAFVQPHVAKGREMGLDRVSLVVEAICVDLGNQRENQTNLDHGVDAGSGSEKSGGVDDSLDAAKVNAIWTCADDLELRMENVDEKGGHELQEELCSVSEPKPLFWLLAWLQLTGK